MTDREKVEKLLAVCRAYGDALDMAFAALVTATTQPMEPFVPSQSPMWPAMANGKRVVEEVDAAISRVA
jgi:hypothetical protein